MVRGPLSDPRFRGQFSGHETFPLRHGWLKKVVDALFTKNSAKRNLVFDPDHAIAHFGVGKNMVVSMKYWALATGVVEQNQLHRIRVSRLGKLLLSDHGLDPYLEQPASLWLLHWRIAGSPQKTTTWYWAFNHYTASTLDRETLAADIIRLCRERAWTRVARSTVRRDVDCFFRTYTLAHTTRGRVNEETLESPFAELQLVTPRGIKGLYTFSRGPKDDLPDGIFNFALAEFWERFREAETLSVETLTHEPGSPGRVFKLDEQSVVDRLARAEDTSGGAFRWSDTAGLQQVLRVKPDIDPLDLLKLAYASPACEVAA